VPFRDVFNAMFFISMGMLVDVGLVIADPGWMLGAVLLVLVLKSLLAGAAALVAGWPMRLSLQVGMGLATISEFGFVLARESEKLRLLPPGAMEELTAVITGTMIIGAALVPFAEKASTILASPFRRGDGDAGSADVPVSQTVNAQVVIVGYGLNGQNLARVLRATNIPCSVVEMNPTLAELAKRAGDRVLVGDATRFSILRQAGIAQARALVVAINDVEATRRIVAQARTARPELYILARTRYIGELEELYRLGARQVIPEEFETSIEIFAHVLQELAIPSNIIEAQVQMIRAGRYGMLRGRPGRPDTTSLLEMLERAATLTFLVTADSPAQGKTIRDLNLRAETGVTIIAVVREGKPTTNPPAEFGLNSGDVLVLVGGHQQLDAAKRRLSATDSPTSARG
jgi:CPA2 family monovalent cation:H+ antiporter-2